MAFFCFCFLSWFLGPNSTQAISNYVIVKQIVGSDFNLRDYLIIYQNQSWMEYIKYIRKQECIKRRKPRSIMGKQSMLTA